MLIIRAKIQEKLSNYVGAVEQLNQAIALYSRFLPALIEKIKLHAVLKEFEQLVDTAFRALVLDKHCIEPQRYLVIYYLAWDSNEESVIAELFLDHFKNLGSCFLFRISTRASLVYRT